MLKLGVMTPVFILFPCNLYSGNVETFTLCSVMCTIIIIKVAKLGTSSYFILI